jgi:hypothetical protein
VTYVFKSTETLHVTVTVWWCNGVPGGSEALIQPSTVCELGLPLHSASPQNYYKQIATCNEQANNWAVVGCDFTMDCLQREPQAASLRNVQNCS